MITMSAQRPDWQLMEDRHHQVKDVAQFQARWNIKDTQKKTPQLFSIQILKARKVKGENEEKEKRKTILIIQTIIRYKQWGWREEHGYKAYLEIRITSWYWWKVESEDNKAIQDDSRVSKLYIWIRSKNVLGGKLVQFWIHRIWGFIWYLDRDVQWAARYTNLELNRIA